VDRILLTHSHGGAELAIAPLQADAGAAGASGHLGLGCAACHARATLDVLAIDAHPESHGAAPFAASSGAPSCVLPAAFCEAPSARAPPSRIV
jgi:hypothetical protein